jgi:hypothetical protein
MRTSGSRVRRRGSPSARWTAAGGGGGAGPDAPPPLNFSRAGPGVECAVLPVCRAPPGGRDFVAPPPLPFRVLVAVTTCNYHNVTRRLLAHSERPPRADYVLFDDASTDPAEVLRVAADGGASAVCRHTTRRGAVPTLNLAWRVFKASGAYGAMVLASNDIVIPPGSLAEQARILAAYPDVALLLPATTAAGLGAAAFGHYAHQNIALLHPSALAGVTEHEPSGAADLQAALARTAAGAGGAPPPPAVTDVLVPGDDLYPTVAKAGAGAGAGPGPGPGPGPGAPAPVPDVLPVPETSPFLAYCLTVTRALAAHEADKARGNLLPGHLVTTGAEGALAAQGATAWVATRAYVWHRKGTTAHDGTKRDDLAASCNDGAPGGGGGG